MLGFQEFPKKRELTVSGDTRIPTHLWIEGEIRRLASEGRGVYVAARGDKTGGIVLQKIADMGGRCRVLIQQRDFEGRLGWADAMGAEIVAEGAADDYIKRSVQRDPDLWVVEIEDRDMRNLLNAPDA